MLLDGPMERYDRGSRRVHGSTWRHRHICQPPWLQCREATVRFGDPSGVQDERESVGAMLGTMLNQAGACK